MFQTSVDLMYGVISLSILVFTGFLVWIMFYVMQILKQGNEVITDIRQKVAEFEEALANIKERVVASTTSISFIASEIKTVADIVKNLSGRKAIARKRSATKKD